MSVIKEEDIIKETLLDVAKKMVIAARTAPKGKGIDNLIVEIYEGDTIKQVADKMIELGEKYEAGGFIRDTGNILLAPVMVVFGTRIQPLGLKICGLCGFENCAEKIKNPKVPCVFNTGDLGIAIGSAVSVATDHRVDNRVMYSVGMALKEMNLFGDDVAVIYAIPLSATSKNPFFDRKC